MKPIRMFFYTVLLATLVGCSAELADYKQNEPNFDLFGYFNGTTKAWGMVQDYTDKQTRRFEVDIEGKVLGNTLTLTEDFIFADGEQSQRVWAIQRSSNGFYIGRADDVIGDAVGQEVGNALQWQYDFLLKTDDGEVEVTFDDWLYRHDETRVFNITKIKKFGIEVGQVTLFFERVNK
ncbi:DUF3833 domain-containing protein [Vibrio ziniensis]|uniref:DUF3833 domain-containing protein n=1 Tax=Vibrio ziniensis TaxID=2711221 RepID=A0A6G7CJA9_9VIBR|nr:DUF3833 domain-containing protein [Vibrio ziniensis]QIH42133.1 DUF3833 domain-containing protein [Vibrio ziniensis]